MLIKFKNCGIIIQISDTRESLLYLSVFSNITLSYEMAGQMVKSLKSFKGCVIMHIFLLYPNGKEKALTLSYDDVTDHNIKFIELLEKFNIKCTFNLNGSRLLSDNADTKLYDNPVYSELTWTRWFFPVINTDETLKKIDEYMQECIRYLATGKRTKSRYNFRYEDIKNLGYRNLVNEYYKFKNVDNV